MAGFIGMDGFAKAGLYQLKKVDASSKSRLYRPKTGFAKKIKILSIEAEWGS